MQPLPNLLLDQLKSLIDSIKKSKRAKNAPMCSQLQTESVQVGPSTLPRSGGSNNLANLQIPQQPEPSMMRMASPGRIDHRDGKGQNHQGLDIQVTVNSSEDEYEEENTQRDFTSSGSEAESSGLSSTDSFSVI